MVAAAIPVPAEIAAKGKSFYRPELDGLRFFAFLSVFLFHFNRPVDLFVQHGVPRALAVIATSLVEGGVFGVDLFFVLSAYLITELLLREKEVCGALDVRAFYVRRILRIWPLYFFYIGVALIPIFNPNHALSWGQAAAFVFLAGNWSVMFWGWPLHSIVGPLWTVSIEEQFYLVWPPIVRHLSRGWLVLAAICMLTIATGVRIAMVAAHGGMNSVWCNTLARLDPIAAGVLAAVVLKGNMPKLGRIARVTLIVAGIVIVALVANNWKIHEPEHLEWIPTLVGFPVVAASCAGIMIATLGSSVVVPRPLSYLGKISYGLYVYHPLGNVLSGLLIPVHTAFLQLALRPVTALAITMLLASLSYTLLEKPFLSLKKRFTHVDSRPV